MYLNLRVLTLLSGVLPRDVREPEDLTDATNEGQIQGESNRLFQRE